MSQRRKIIAGQRLDAQLVETDDLPPELRLGPVIEIWSPLDSPSPEITSWRRHAQARASWAAAHGLGPRDRLEWPEVLRRSRPPWSFARLAKNDPVRLQEVLAEAGVPASWVPTYCASTDYTPQPAGAAGLILTATV